MSTTRQSANIGVIKANLGKLVKLPVSSCSQLMRNKGDLSHLGIWFGVPHNIAKVKINYMNQIGIITYLSTSDTEKLSNRLDSENWEHLEKCVVHVTSIPLFNQFKELKFKFVQDHVLLTKLVFNNDIHGVEYFSRNSIKPHKSANCYTEKALLIIPPWYNSDNIPHGSWSVDHVNASMVLSTMIKLDNIEYLEHIPESTNSVLSIDNFASYLLLESVGIEVKMIDLNVIADPDQYRIAKYLVKKRRFSQALRLRLSKSTMVYIIQHLRNDEEMMDSCFHEWVSESPSRDRKTFDDMIANILQKSTNDNSTYTTSARLLSEICPASQDAINSVINSTSNYDYYDSYQQTMLIMGDRAIETCEMAVDLSGCEIDQESLEARYLAGDKVLFRKMCGVFKRPVSDEVQSRLLESLKIDSPHVPWNPPTSKQRALNVILGGDHNIDQPTGTLSAIITLAMNDNINKEFFAGASNVLDYLMKYVSSVSRVKSSRSRMPVVRDNDFGVTLH